MQYSRGHFKRLIAEISIFGSDAKAASAVEFALVSLPFFLLLAGIIQISLIVWAAQNLDDALQRASRVIYTGTFQNDSGAEASQSKLLNNLKSVICGEQNNKIPTVFNCGGLRLDVTLSSSFASGNVPPILDPKTGDWSSNFGSRYSCASPGAIVVVTAAVKFPVAFSILNAGATQFSDGSRLLQSTAVFRTEPYQTSGSGC